MSPFIVPMLLVLALIVGVIGFIVGRHVESISTILNKPENMIHAECVECDFESHPGTFSQAQAAARNHSKNTEHPAVMLVGPNDR